jgi:hypothetical protein
MNIIQKMLENFLSIPENEICFASGKFTANDFNNLVEVLNSTDKDFVIFDNGGGKTFEIWLNDSVGDTNKINKFVNYLLKNNKHWLYCYQINNEQTIIREI